jgi:hypothetical protein
MSDRPRPDNTGESIGEGNHGPDYKSPLGRRENADKAAGNPKENQAEAERISHEEARHRGGLSGQRRLGAFDPAR